jgi:hypothetical protein
LSGGGLALVVLLSLGYLAGDLGDRVPGTPLNLEPPTPTAAVKGIVLLVGGIVLAARLARAAKAGPAEASPQGREVHGLAATLCLTAFSLGQVVIRFMPKLDWVDTAAIFGLTSASLVLVVFLRQTGSRLREAAQVMTYALASVSIFGVAARLVALADFARAAIHTKLIMLAVSGFGFLILVLPVLLRSASLRSSVSDWLMRHPGPRNAAIGLTAVTSVAAIWLPSILVNEGEQSVILARLGWFGLFVGSLGLLAAHPPNTPAPSPATPLPLPSYPRWVGIVLLATLGAYLAFSSVMASRWNDFLDPDGLVYLSIGKQFASGEPAIRGYWSPMLSWITGALILSGLPEVAAFRMATILAGGLWVLAAYLTGGQLRLSPQGQAVFLLAIGAIAAGLSVTLTTPDVLGTAAFLFYFAATLRLNPDRSLVRQGVLIGILGAVGYFSKYYNLPVFGLHLILAAVSLPAARRSWRVGLILTSFVTAALFVLPWTFALASRYGHFTFTTSAAINQAIVGPGGELLHRCWYHSLCSLPGDVPFPWEDPHPAYYPVYGWSPFASLENFRHAFALVFGNLYFWLSRTWIQLGPAIPIGLLVAGICVLIRWDNRQARWPWLILFLTPLLYTSGYFLSWSEDSRYYYPVFTLGLLAGFLLLERIVREYLSNVTKAGLARTVISASLITLPLAGLLDIDHFAGLLKGHSPTCLSQPMVLDPEILVAPTAGLDGSVNFLAHRAGIRTYGVTRAIESLELLDQTLREHGISTLVVPLDSPLIGQLALDAHFPATGEFRFCGTRYLALDTRSDGKPE